MEDLFASYLRAHISAFDWTVRSRRWSTYPKDLRVNMNISSLSVFSHRHYFIATVTRDEALAAATSPCFLPLLDFECSFTGISKDGFLVYFSNSYQETSLALKDSVYFLWVSGPRISWWAFMLLLTSSLLHPPLPPIANSLLNTIFSTSLQGSPVLGFGIIQHFDNFNITTLNKYHLPHGPLSHAFCTNNVESYETVIVISFLSGHQGHPQILSYNFFFITPYMMQRVTSLTWLKQCLGRLM